MKFRPTVSRPRALAASLAVAAAALLGVFGPGSLADDGDDDDHHQAYIYGAPASPSQAWAISAGGRLYDNWMTALHVDAPAGTHRAYPAAGKKTGATTWRCKECHGWDYKGRDGQYAEGSHFTGIKGLRSVQGAAPERIAQTVRGAPHRYGKDMIPDAALARLALFLSKGQHDTDAFIDPKSGDVRGDTERGASIYQNVCAACHGFDGRAINWGETDEPGYVGTEAKANPWEVLHKIRNGHPGAEMVSLRAFALQDAVDVLSYARTLPEK